jgi:protein involved in polysaccharide export with SLBB domain
MMKPMQTENAMNATIRTVHPAARGGACATRWRSLGMAVLGLLLAATLGAQEGAPAAAGDQLRAGDVVRLRIWMEPELSGDFPVGEEGTVVLPRIGPLAATGEPVAMVRERIVTAYAAFLSHSSIDVTLLRRVQVLGAVRTPGLYHVDPSMNIGDVVALAGGATTHGRIDRVELFRGGHRVSTELSPLTAVAGSPIRSGDQLRVPEKSWAARNPGVLIGGISAVLSFTLAVLR